MNDCTRYQNALTAFDMQERLFMFTILMRSTLLLPHFIRHYARLGFTDLVVAIHSDATPYDWDSLRAENSSMQIHLEECYRGCQLAHRDAALVNWLRVRYVADWNDWNAWADLDEFYEYPCDLRELSLHPTINTIVGHFVDRVAEDGSLPEIQPDVPLEVQFPREVFLTQRIVRGCVRKVMLFRGANLIRTGHHQLCRERAWIRQGRVHHFKWTSQVLEHLSDRVAFRAGKLPAGEPNRFLSYWRANGRIKFEDCT